MNRLSHLPVWLSYWLGYRSPAAKSAKPPPLYLVSFWSFVGAFCGLAVILATFGHSQYFIERQVPAIVASFVGPKSSKPLLAEVSRAGTDCEQGASAVLCYGAIEAPFSQPRALVGGHFISALIGLCITKLFRLLPDQRFNDLEWLVASLCTATAIVAMQLTKTTHPPAGATALLPATSPEIWITSWYFLPVVLLSSMLVLVTALVINNIQRRYPLFWVSPANPKPMLLPEKTSGPRNDGVGDTAKEEAATETAIQRNG